MQRKLMQKTIAYAKDYSWNEREIKKLEKTQKRIDKILNDYYDHPDDYE